MVDDQEQTNESEAQKRARAAGEQAQSDAESGASGSMINSEPWSGGGNDGDQCTMTDGRVGVVRRTATGLVCVVESKGTKEGEE